jgi:homoaconitase/3-isopropylmalate dehydratase large subunit
VQYLKPIVSVAGKKWKAPGCVLCLGVVVQMLIVTDPGTSDLLDIVFRSP